MITEETPNNSLYLAYFLEENSDEWPIIQP